MINIIFTILVLLFISLLWFIFWIISQGKNIRQEIKNSQASNQALGLIQQEVCNLRSEVRNSLEGTHKNINERLDTTLGQVQHQLGALSQALPNICELGHRIAEFQNIMQAPKLRGGMGEFFLGNLLEQVFGQHKGCYELQYTFKSGEKVDAVIRISDKLVPVDSKFPLENFKKYINTNEDNTKKIMRRNFIDDVKKHITSIANKYILTDEGTFDFALMYIPAENVYYEIIVKDNDSENKSLAEFALSKKIIPVSPNSFYPYLQVIIMGLKGLTVEKGAQEVIQNLYRLNADLEKFSLDFNKLGKHLKDSFQSFEEASKRLNKFQDKLQQVEHIPLKPPSSSVADCNIIS